MARVVDRAEMEAIQWDIGDEGFSTSSLFKASSCHGEKWLAVIKQVDKIATDEEAKKLRDIYQGIEDALEFARSSKGKFSYMSYETDVRQYSDVLGEMLVSRGYKPDEIMCMWHMRFTDYCYQGGKGYGFGYGIREPMYMPKYLKVPSDIQRDSKLQDFYRSKFLGIKDTLHYCPHHWCIRPVYFEFAKPSLLEMMAILSSPFTVGISGKITEAIWGD